MKNPFSKLKLFFLTFLGVCLGLTSFSSALTFEFDNNLSGILLSGNNGGLSNYVEANLYKFVEGLPTNGTIGVDGNFVMKVKKEDMPSNCSASSFYLRYNPTINSFSYYTASSTSTQTYFQFFDSTFMGSGLIVGSPYNTSLSTWNWSAFNFCTSSVLQDGYYVYTGSVPYTTYNMTLSMNEFKYKLYIRGFVQRFTAYNTSHPDILLDINIHTKYIFSDYYFSEGSSSVDCSQDSNYLQCLEDKNQLIGQVSTLSGSLSSCQSDLSDCMGGQDASLLACIDQKEQCESSLNTLSGNYASLENMNSSLSSQLQECLENASNSTGELICNKFDLFWSSDNTDYSFPINNDLILPPGYKGFVNEGVLAIKKDSSLDSAYSIDDEEFQDVIDSYGVVFLYIFGSALFLVFLYMIRKYFIGLKS